MAQQIQPDRFLAVLALATETVRTEEATLRTIARSSTRPDQLITAYLQTRRQWYELLETMVGHSNDDDDEDVRVHINIPANWDDPIAVVPSNQQIADSMMELPEDSEPGTCAICQDSIQHRPDGCSLRNCGHHFHDNCITEWFSHSVRCPVCRNDIRESTEETS